ncbi:MAG: ABC transporter permease [Chloroflexi bacterium]|nr:ABC transporter permease [Chloroflexota bacterium]
MPGLLVIFKKELADHFTSWRFIILFILVLLAGTFATMSSAQNIRATSTDPNFIFLKLFSGTQDGSLSLSFLEFIKWFIPIVGIALGFDAVNGERNSGTMSRLVSQPVYRDTIINGKFAAGVATIAVMMASIILLVSGFGLRVIGLPPTSEEIARILFFFVVTVIFGSFWMALAVLFSILFRRVATSALASIGIWVFFTFFMNPLMNVLSRAISPPGNTIESATRFAQVNLNLLHLSPLVLFDEAMSVLLDPAARSYSQLLRLITGGGGMEFFLSNPLSLGQSLMTVWPQLIGIFVLTLGCFAISYIRFMREEIRAT